jgi:foldase protein PrsA
MNKEQKGEQAMKKLRRMKIVSLTILIILLLTACQSKAERNELTNHIGKSVSTFERRAGVRLAEQSNGVYAKEGVVQILAPKKKITSVTVMSNGTKFTVSGLKISMAKEEADKLLKAAYGKEISMTENKAGNTVTYSYAKDNRELYVSYDATKNTISELSYYKVDKTKQKAEATGEPKDLGELMVMVGDTKVYYNEAMAHLILARDNYETNYGKNIWNADIFNNGEAFGKVIKEEVINQITELKIIRAKAMKLNISLSEEEKAQAATYAKTQYQKLTDEDKQSYQITEGLLQSVYEDNLLANKVFENLTINVDTNVADKEAKQITIQDIFIRIDLAKQLLRYQITLLVLLRKPFKMLFCIRVRFCPFILGQFNLQFLRFIPYNF